MRVNLTLIVVFILCISSPGFGQEAKLDGHVVDDKEALVARVRIIAPGGQAAKTDGKGHFRIDFPSSIRAGRAMRIAVNKSGWVVFEPMFGNTTTQNLDNFEPLKVVIVPLNSPLSYETKRLSDFVGEYQKYVKSLGKK